MKDFAGRTAFVTGGANGVGIGIVRNLLAEGCKVAIADIRQNSIDQALATLDNREVIGIKLDVSSREGFKEAADEAEAALGPVSLVFNNAGVNLFQTIEDSSYDDWDWVMGVNFGGVVNGVMTFAPRMKARALSGEPAGGLRGGHIVNTASMASFLGSGAPGIYNTAKFAVRGLSYSLRHSMYQYGVGVSVVHPGLVKSYIYASDDIRPDELKGAAKPVDHHAVERLAGIHEYGMEPDVIGVRILDGIRENRANIFTHPDHKEEVREIFDEILADYRDYPEDAGFEQRVGFEKLRRDNFAEIRRKANEVG